MRRQQYRVRIRIPATITVPAYDDGEAKKIARQDLLDAEIEWGDAEIIEAIPEGDAVSLREEE